MKKKIKAKPIHSFEVTTKIELYPAKFKPAEYTRYLDKGKLLKAKKVILEIGTIEFDEGNVPLIAKIKNGMIVQLRLKSMEGCKDCEESDTDKLSNSALDKIMSQIAKSKIPILELPTPVILTPTGGISIGKIVVIGKGSRGCIYYRDGNYICVICWWGKWRCYPIPFSR